MRKLTDAQQEAIHWLLGFTGCAGQVPRYLPDYNSIGGASHQLDEHRFCQFEAEASGWLEKARLLSRQRFPRMRLTPTGRAIVRRYMPAGRAVLQEGER